MTFRVKIIVVMLAAGMGCAAWGAASPAKKGKPAIPPDLSFEFKPVPAEENAIVDWRKASKVEVPLDDRLRLLLRYCWTPGAAPVSEEDHELYRVWFKRNKEALDIFNASLQKPKAQWFETDPQIEEPEIGALSHLTRARLFEADELAEKKNFREALVSLEGSHRLVQLGIEGDAGLLKYLVAGNLRVLVDNAIVRLASRREVPVEILEQLLKDLPELKTEADLYSQVLRVVISRSINHSTDVKKLAEEWSKALYANSLAMLYPPDMRRPIKILMEPALVSQHPQPYDEIESIEASIREARIYRTNAYSAWTNRSDVIETEREELRTQFKKDIGPLMELLKDEPLPLNWQAVQKARKTYQGIENPVGRLFDYYPFGDVSDSDLRVFQFRTDRAASRILVALLIFEKRKGTLPLKLSDLVEEKILDAVPFDPFADAPISYSRVRQIIWSVNENAVSDNGAANEKYRWAGDDAVWQIPKIN